jgi:hypothetical protein
MRHVAAALVAARLVSPVAGTPSPTPAPPDPPTPDRTPPPGRRGLKLRPGSPVRQPTHARG